MPELGKISKPSIERFNNKKRLIYVPIFFIPPQLTEIKENNPFNEYCGHHHIGDVLPAIR